MTEGQTFQQKRAFGLIAYTVTSYCFQVQLTTYRYIRS